MILTRDDWGRLHATPRLVEYLVESPPHAISPVPCRRLILYLTYAKYHLAILKSMDGLSPPLNVPGPKLADELDFRTDQVASFIENYDIDLRGMLDAQPHMTWESDHSAISHVYARTVVGSENDVNCDQILASLRQGGLHVPQAGICQMTSHS
jgi:hypothetical protein